MSPPPADPLQAHRRTLTVALLCLILGLGFSTRLTNLAGVFAGGRIFLGADDAYYHMRRVEASLAQLPRVPTRDAYVNFPEGALLDWPIGFDLLLAGICKLGQLFSSSSQAPAAVAAVAIPFLGLIACLLVYALGRALCGRAAGLLAALLAALLPILTGYAMVGRVDHHVLEPTAVLLPLLLALLALRARDDRRARLLATGSGLCLALGVCFWPGALVASALLFGSLVLLLARRTDDGGARRRLTALAPLIFGAGAAAMVLVSVLHPWAWRGDFVYFAPSWLQPLVLSIAALSLLAFRYLERRAAFWARLGLLLGVPLLLAGIAMLCLPGLRESFDRSFAYLLRREIQISQVFESRPLLADGMGKATQQYTLLLLGLPASILWALLAARRSGEPQATGLRLFSAWFVLATPFGLAQVRLGSIFAPLFCVGSALAIVEIYRALRRRATSRWLPAAAVGGGVLVLLLPTAALHHPVKFVGPPELLRSLDALHWLRQRAPASGAARPDQPPRFGTMSRWQWGHFLLYFSGQANIANPLGQTEENLRGVRRSAVFSLSTDPGRALRMLEELRVRYVMVTPVLEELEQLAPHAGERPSTFLERQPGGVVRVKPPYFLTMNTRLLHYDGRRFALQGVTHPPLRTLRLVFESAAEIDELGRRLSYCKVFERVPGARLFGQGPPRGSVELQLALRISSGRVLLYRDRTVADDRGRYSLVVPYASEQSDRGLYQLLVAGRPITARVTNADVEGGRRVEAGSPAAP